MPRRAFPISRIAPPLLLLASALAVSPAHAADDGTPGETSTGTFEVSLNVDGVGEDVVEVVGLDNRHIDLGTIQSSYNDATPIVIPDMFFCLMRSTPGNVRVTVAREGDGGINYPFRLTNRLTSPTNPGSGSDFIGMTLYLYAPDGTAAYLSNGEPVELPRSAPGCTATSGQTEAHRLNFVANLPAYNAAPLQGLYEGVFTITIAIP